jgi:uncharacterized protein (DUF433 family)
MMTTTDYHHIELDEHGVPWIVGTRIKVVEIAIDRLAHAWDAEELHQQHPALSLAQIHSALAYYYDHQQAIDRDIEDRIRREEEFFAKLPPSPIQDKLRKAKSQK